MLLRAPPTLHYLNGATADENFGRSLFSSSSVSTPSPRVCMAVKGGSSNSRPLAAVVFKPFGEVKMEISLVPSVPQQSLARQKYANEQIKFVISRAKRKSSRQVFPNLISCVVEESKNEGSSGSDETTPGATIDLKLPRRSLLLHFTCNSCGERSKKLINRLAYEKGTVFVQCTGCSQYHKLVDNLNLVVEYDLREEINMNSDTNQV